MVRRLRIVFFGDAGHEYSNRAFMYLARHPDVDIAGAVIAATRRSAAKPWSGWPRRLRSVRDRLTKRQYSCSFTEIARSESVPTFNMGDAGHPALLDWLSGRDADLFLCVTYPHLIKKPVYGLPPLGTINVHPSLLPAYRGSHPIFWAIRNGERWIGATAFRMDDGIDTGPIVAQCRVPILRGDTFWRAYDRVMSATPALLDEIIRQASSQSLDGIPQDDALSSWYSIPRLRDYVLYFWRVCTSQRRRDDGR